MKAFHKHDSAELVLEDIRELLYLLVLAEAEKNYFIEQERERFAARRRTYEVKDVE